MHNTIYIIACETNTYICAYIYIFVLDSDIFVTQFLIFQYECIDLVLGPLKNHYFILIHHSGLSNNHQTLFIMLRFTFAQQLSFAMHGSSLSTSHLLSSRCMTLFGFILSNSIQQCQLQNIRLHGDYAIFILDHSLLNIRCDQIMRFNFFYLL